MPKQKREDDEEIAEVAAVLYERWDSDMIMSINELVLDPQTEAVVSALAAEMRPSLSNPDPTIRRIVSYSAREFKKGRVYGQGLQGVGGWIRRVCSYRYYHDLGIVNCGPTILYQILEKCGGCPRPWSKTMPSIDQACSDGFERKRQS
jgi:hypothetical protein